MNNKIEDQIIALERTIADAKQQLNMLRLAVFGPSGKGVSPKEKLHLIARVCCDQYGYTFDEMMSKSRTAGLSKARQVAIWITRTITQQSLAEIGAFYGGRDHGTVIFACKAVRDRAVTNKEDREACEKALETAKLAIDAIDEPLLMGVEGIRS